MSEVREIASDIQRQVTTGHYPPGRPLPSESALAELYGTTRNRVRQALKTLADRGLLAPRPGSGWHITRTLRAADPSPQKSLGRWAKTLGMQARARILAAEWYRPDVEELQLLRLGPDDEVLRVTRIRTLEDHQVSLERSLFARQVAREVADAEWRGAEDVARLADETIQSVAVERDHTIDAVAASSEDSRLLDIRRGGPLLRVRRRSFDPQGHVVELGDDRYPPGTIAFRAGDGSMG